MHKLHILTRCSRPDFLVEIYASIKSFKDSWEKAQIQQGDSSQLCLKWWLLIDSRIVKDIDAEFIFTLESEGGRALFLRGQEGDFGHGLLNQALDLINDGFVYFLDDDNILHPDFHLAFKSIESFYPAKQAIVFSQRVGGKDWTGLEVREARPENTRVQGIDMAQFILARELIAEQRFPAMEYKADGIFIEKLFQQNSEKFHFSNQIYCYYNYLTKSQVFAPKVLYIGNEQPQLKGHKTSQHESDELKMCCESSDASLSQSIIKYQPDVIVSTGPDWEKLSALNSSPWEIRRRWIHTLELNQDTGEHAYQAAINWALSRDNKELISFFTPVYNLAEQLKVTYQSLQQQTYKNWEWVIVNDSSDGGKTLKVAEFLASQDSRISLYDFRYKTNGNVGEAKYRAAMLCKGDILAELDHDDYLVPECADILMKAAARYPEAGFFYSDFVELDCNWKSLKYRDGFALGYGSYRQEECLGKLLDVANSLNINPKTLRHIVGMPNHVRAWRRSVYLAIGGHNRKLCVADDYEITLLTFLTTKMLRIPRLCYLQFISSTGSNTQSRARSEIQRRVRSISHHYNEQIKLRFEDLGLEDWAYLQNKENPLIVESRFGDEEGYANLVADGI